MPTHESESKGIGSAAKAVAERASTLARLELELAQVEVKRKFAAFGIGAALLAVSGVLGLFALGFGLAGAAAGIETQLPAWASLLLVAAGLLIVATVLGIVGLGSLKAGSPPVPEQAIEEAKLTSEALKANGRH